MASWSCLTCRDVTAFCLTQNPHDERPRSSYVHLVARASLRRDPARSLTEIAELLDYAVEVVLALYRWTARGRESRP